VISSATRTATWLAAALLLLGLSLWLAGAAPAVLLLHAGLWLLIATPIARAGIALAGFVREGEWTFVALTVVVLGCLVLPILSFLLSARG
jgi:uncharacterized membrane protein